MCVGSRQLDLAKSEGCQGLSMIRRLHTIQWRGQAVSERESIYYQNGCKVPTISQMAGSSYVTLALNTLVLLPGV